MKRVFQKLLNFGLARYCPVCSSRVRKFTPYGLKPRPEAQCPVCKSLERHRLVWVFFKERTSLFDGDAQKMLHFAPEPEFSGRFKKISSLDYVSADLFDPNAMLKADISNIPCPDESFDVVYCSHVLEHVEDDRKAIAEIYRVLKKGGQAVILVPITAEKTIEDPSITDPHEREKQFGQKDHVRRYGIDVANRLTEGCFEVRTVYASDLLSTEQIKTMGLSFLDEKKMPIFLCSKQ